jgi:hypothetical protein
VRAPDTAGSRPGPRQDRSAGRPLAADDRQDAGAPPLQCEA